MVKENNVVETVEENKIKYTDLRRLNLQILSGNSFVTICELPFPPKTPKGEEGKLIDQWFSQIIANTKNDIILTDVQGTRILIKNNDNLVIRVQMVF